MSYAAPGKPHKSCMHLIHLALSSLSRAVLLGVHPTACRCLTGPAWGAPHSPAGCRGGWGRGELEHWAAERLCNLRGSHAERDLPVNCGPQPQTGAGVIDFRMTRCGPPTRPGVQVRLASASSLLPLYPPARAFPHLASGNFARPVLVYANLFHPFLWAEALF